jgi:hypothetical protein
MANLKGILSLMERIENKQIFEGIDFDTEKLTVSYNPNHEENVDTSIENNPTNNTEIIPGVNVWYIFKRKRGFRGDGNPLIYALKGEKGWTFNSEEDRIAIENQFDLIATKFATLYPIGVTVIIPSGNELNHHIADVIKSKSPDAKIIEGVICKLTTEEVEDIVLDKSSEFRKYYGSEFNTAFKRLTLYLDDMDTHRKGTFSRHFVKDNEMRDVLNFTLKVSTDKYATYANLINDKDILIIDDTISRGQSINEACKIMMESYSPKSITVLTLLSKLY